VERARADRGKGKPGLLTTAERYIEVFYNQRRRHSTLGQSSPAAFERRAVAQAA
jgi:transposase InsO family protein